MITKIIGLGTLLLALGVLSSCAYDNAGVGAGNPKPPNEQSPVGNLGLYKPQTIKTVPLGLLKDYKPPQTAKPEYLEMVPLDSVKDYKPPQTAKP